MKLTVGDRMVCIDLFDDQAQKTVAGIRKLLPLRAHTVHCKFAGYEIMIPIPAIFEKENQVEKVVAGDVGYYVDNGILCLFYGKIFPFAGVNLVGKVSGTGRPGKNRDNHFKCGSPDGLSERAVKIGSGIRRMP